MFIKIALICLIPFSALAADFRLKCTAFQNSEKLMETETTLGISERNKVLQEAGEWQFILSSNGAKKIELQAFQMYEPTRSYATAYLTEKGSNIELSIWKREYLMEVRCTLL